MKFRTIHAALCCALLLAPFSARAQEVVDIFDYLAGYEFGQSREPLQLIDTAIEHAQVNPFEREILARRFAGMMAQPEVTLDAKRYIARKLALIGGASVVPTLAPLLEDESLALLAVQALERIPGEEASAALRAALAANPPARIAAGLVNAVALRADAEAVELVAAQARSADSEVARAAIAALGALGGELARETLESLWTEGPEAQRDAAAAAFLRTVDELAESGQYTLARGKFIALYESSAPVHVRAGALGSLARHMPEHARARVEEAFFGPDPALRAAAAGLVRDLMDTPLRDRFLERRGELDAPGQALLLGALLDSGTPLEEGTLLEFARFPESAVRVLALGGLARWGGAESAERLVTVASSGERAEQDAARRALARHRAEGVEAILARLADEADEARGVEALRALVERRAAGLPEILLHHAASARKPLRDEAWRGLRQVAQADEVPAMTGLLEAAPSQELREQAETVLAAVIRRMDDPTQGAQVVIGAYEHQADADVRLSLLNVLGEAGADIALASLLGALEDPAPAFRAAALRGLANWPNPAPFDALMGIVVAPKESGERGTALRGAVRMLRAAPEWPAAERLGHYELLMAHAADDGERNAILSGLAEIARPETLELLEEFRGADGIAAELGLTRARIAREIAGAHPELARAVAEELLADPPADAAAEQARQTLHALAHFEDYLVAWEVSGPYTVPGRSGGMLFAESFAPESDPERAAWRIMPAGLDEARPFVLDLGKAIGGADRVAYLRTVIDSEEARGALLEAGSSDGIKIWLNGAEVHEVNVGRALTPGEDRVEIALEAGENELLVAVNQHGGDWGAALRLRAPDGGPLEGVSARVRE